MKSLPKRVPIIVCSRVWVETATGQTRVMVKNEDGDAVRLDNVVSVRVTENRNLDNTGTTVKEIVFDMQDIPAETTAAFATLVRAGYTVSALDRSFCCNHGIA